MTRRWTALLLGVIATVLVAPGGARAGSVTIAAEGSAPGVAVDPTTGTAHIAFRTAPVANVGHVTYCRLPRGASACAPSVTLTNPGGYDQLGRTQVIATGTNVYVFTEMLSGSNLNADGLWMWTSTNGGTSFGGPVQVIHGMSVSRVIPGPGPYIFSAVDDTVTDGIDFGIGALDPAHASGANSYFAVGAPTATSSTTAISAGGPGLINQNVPFAVMAGDGSVWLRTFKKTTTGYTNPANWNDRVLVATGASGASVASSVTGTSSGAYISYEKTQDSPGGQGLGVRRVLDDGSLGPEHMVTTVNGVAAVKPNDSTLFEDPSGRVSAAYFDEGNSNALTYQWSKDGDTWGVPQVLDQDVTGDNNIQVADATDGGGVLVLDRTDAGVDAGAYGQIRVYALPVKGASDPPAPPTPTPPPAGNGGGAPAAPTPQATPAGPTCTKAPVEPTKDTIAVVRSGACFANPSKGIYTSSGTVRLNGIDFIPQAGGGTITVDTTKHTIATSGKVDVSVGLVDLAQTPVTIPLDQGTVPMTGLQKFGVQLTGFPVVGNADLTFSKQKTTVGLNLKLPFPLSAGTGSVSLTADMDQGLETDSIEIKADSIPLGVITFVGLDVKYDGGTGTFEGKVGVALGPSSDGDKLGSASFGMDDGRFSYATLEFDPPTPLEIFAPPPIAIDAIDFKAASNPDGFSFGGGFDLIVGEKILGQAIVSLDALQSDGGGVTFTIPAVNYVPKKELKITASGTVKVVGVPFGHGGFSLDTNGLITFSGNTEIDFDFGIDAAFGVSGGIDIPSGKFYALGQASATVDIKIASVTGELDAIVSSIGIAGCGKLSGELFSDPSLSASISVGYDRKWSDTTGELTGGCKYNDYIPAVFKQVPPSTLPTTGSTTPATSPTAAGARAATGDAPAASAARLAAGAPQGISLGGGPSQEVLVSSASGRPSFTLSGPGGRLITVPAGGGFAANTGDPAKGGSVAGPSGPNAVVVQIKHAQGVWALTPDPASPPIAKVQTAGELPTPSIHTSVRKVVGRKRIVTVTASNLGPLQLLVRERTPGGGSQDIGTVKRAGSTSLSFTPADGPAGKRNFDAVLVAPGQRQVGDPTIGSYVVPPMTLPAAPRSVTLKRSASSIAVRWTKVTGAAKYRVAIKSSDGRVAFIDTDAKTTKAVVPSVTTDDTVSIAVGAFTPLGLEGKTKTATSKATRKPVKKAAAKKATAKKKG